MAHTVTVYMVRHGETDANIKDIIQGESDVPLNANGIRQAECVGKRLKDFPFDAIYSSDLSRAAVTARSIADGREIIYTEELREWHLGIWQGKSLEYVEKEYPEEFEMFRTNSIYFRPAGGESICEFRDRAAKFLAEIAKKHTDQTVLCVTHGGFLRAVLLNIMEMEKYPNKARTDNTSISCFKTVDGGKSWQLVMWNDSSHLTGNMTSSSGW